MPKIVRGDSDRVVQIFANLINNSIKFTLCKSKIFSYSFPYSNGQCQYSSVLFLRNSKIYQMVSIPNAFKWFTAGHIILRGWCENPNSYGDNDSFTVEKKNLVCSQKTITKKHENHAKKTSNNDNKTILWFEVDDTGCGMSHKYSIENRPFCCKIKNIFRIICFRN
jgi:signal transduction histidine kinase